ncbi:hypothetical protein F0L74_27095 [Chitinophaga agrisoli]|uniref:Uncharacterized protein n=1 Tax=Chitinophaga agrisoli TaxID=2607653 RepID=A0A5B2VN59_9BACT|nr:hypothetical protein [Chitinophaga agrisoli]KAA2239856.1 hypothetical protein F0L74_27095 [Chitinophaga agrisoli]
MKVTGKTNENVLITGRYYCQDHPAIESDFARDQHFPSCHFHNHETIWELKQSSSAGQNTQEEKPETETPQASAAQPEDKDADDVQIDEQYKKGFNYALLGGHVDAVIKEETTRAQDIITLNAEKYQRQLDVLRAQYIFLDDQLQEKDLQKQAFAANLPALRKEYEDLKAEIKAYRLELRAEVTKMGELKEDLVSKRIERFGQEIEKLTQVYHGIEDKNNTKFRTDLATKKVRPEDKQFYEDYRTKLQQSFEFVQKRISMYEREGLNNIIAGFLTTIGWIAAFCCSWFFESWRETMAARGQGQQATGLLTYILDHLRLFAAGHSWWVSALTLSGYLLTVMLIARYCYMRSMAEKFITREDDKAGAGQKDNIEFNTESDSLIKGQFKAKNWYELWLKITPFIAAVVLLVGILAFATPQTGYGDSYQALSESLALQVIGFLLPVAFSVIVFFYITHVMESRVLRPRQDANAVPKRNWEIAVFMLSIVGLIGLLMASRFVDTSTLNLIHPWGFFIGSICTGLALGYGYRIISLYESYEELINRIHHVNQFIDWTFYPREISYSKSNEVIGKTHELYKSLLDLMAHRNYRAIHLLSPELKITIASPTEAEKNNDNEQEEASPEKETEKANPVKRLMNLFSDVLTRVVQGWKWKVKMKEDKIKELERKIEELKKETVSVDEWTYYPGPAAKIEELKACIKELEKSRDELKEELDGYYSNTKTYGLLNQQITQIVRDKEVLSLKIALIEDNMIKEKEKKLDALDFRVNNISQGYQVGRHHWDNQPNQQSAN